MCPTWIDTENGPDVLYDEDELIIEYYIAIDHLIHFPDDHLMLDAAPVTPEVADVLEEAHPGMFFRSGERTGSRPLGDLAYVRGESVSRIAGVSLYSFGTIGVSTQAVNSEWNLNLLKEHRDGELELPYTLIRVQVHVDSLLLFHTELRDSLGGYNVVRDAAQVDERVHEHAFRDAVGFVARWAESSYRLMRNVLHIVNAKTLDPLIPYVIHKATSDEALDYGYAINPDRLGQLSAQVSPRTINLVEDFSNADNMGPISEYLSIMQEAESAFQRGLNLSSVVVAASAAESLLNTVRFLLEWERGTLPDELAAAGGDGKGIQASVSRWFSGLLGGDWDLGHAGPLRDWARQVADVRNLAVHAGFSPTTTMAQDAMRATHALHRELADRIMAGRNLKKFTRTAKLVAGIPGLAARGRLTKHVAELISSDTESDWAECSTRWIEQYMQCLMANKYGWDEEPGDFVVVVRVHDRRFAVIEHGWGRGWAREVKNPLACLDGYDAKRLFSSVESLVKSGLEYVTVQLREVSQYDSLSFSRKFPAFRLVPEYRVTPGTPSAPELRLLSLTEWVADIA